MCFKDTFALPNMAATLTLRRMLAHVDDALTLRCTEARECDVNKCARVRFRNILI